MPTRRADPIGDRETQRPPVELMLRSLPAQHREIIVATYFHRRTTREAARLLGLAPDAAKARLYQAMRDLSDLLVTGRPDHAGPYPAARANGWTGRRTGW
jgi:RNA polymerase sigma-70 factor (ECF subfamily)